MNVWEEIITNIAACTQIKSKMSMLKGEYEKKDRANRSQKYDEESALRDKWYKIEADLKEEYQSVYGPLQEKVKALADANEELQGNLLLARAVQQGYRPPTMGIPFKFFSINVFVEAPSGRSRSTKYSVSLELLIDRDEFERVILKGFRTRGIMNGYQRKILERKFDSSADLIGYMERNRDKYLAPFYTEDQRLYDIATDPKYQDIVTNEFDMEIAWGHTWSGETTNTTKTVAITEFSEDNVPYKARVRHVKGNTFKVSAKKVGDDTSLTDKDKEVINDHIINHISRPSIFYVRRPELVWE